MSSLHILIKNPVASAFYSTKYLNGEDAGFDLYVPEDVTFSPGETKFVGMGISATVVEENPVAYWMAPRSSISKTGLMMRNSMGVIDKGYRGELIAALWNTKDVPVNVKKGDRLVQIVARNMESFASVKIVESLPESKRGSGGFGSTGI
jgi:dUTP pyrophosphatase